MADALLCARLGRDDGKWYLGGGERLIWTPPHPEYVDTLGFWDEAHYYDVALPSPFTITLLGDNGHPIDLYRTDHHWRPDRLQQTFATKEDLEVIERKSILPNDVLTSSLELYNTSKIPQTIHLVAWTRRLHHPEDPPRLLDVTSAEGQVCFTQQIQKNDRPPYEVDAALGLSPDSLSTSIVPSESGPDQPVWTYTPFVETLTDFNLGPLLTQGDAPVWYAGVHTSLSIAPEDSATVSASLAIAPNRDTASSHLQEALRAEDPISLSTDHWETQLGRAPDFSCSDLYLEAYYWYRWYGLTLFTRSEPEGNFQYPAVYEGPEYFRKHISYSAQCHMREMRWLPDPEVAQGSLLNFLHTQREDGGFYGHVFPHHVHKESFYHTNWGHTWDVHTVHPDLDFLERAYEGLTEYVAYFDRERDPDDSGLYDIFNHYETGQEYMHRYMVVETSADEVHWGRIFRLKGVDAAVQLYETKRALANMAKALGRPEESETWTARAETTKTAVRSQMWDPDDELFYDLDPRSGNRTGVKAAVCFYPYFTDIVTEEHLPGLKQHLLDPDTFWTPYPVPASSQDDPSFSAAPHWKGQRMNCPWNGRAWPMTNSHVAEALAQSALRFEDDELRAAAATFMTRFIQTLFFEGNPDRPNCFEHYNPLTGQACQYRGIDDYQHSWIVDLLTKYLCGIRPQDDHVVVDPFPFDVDRVEVSQVSVRNHELGVLREGDHFTVTVDDTQETTSSLGEAIRLDL